MKNRVSKKNRDRIFFVSWIIEAYKRKHGISGKEASGLFRQHRLDEWLFEHFDVLHTAGTEYVVMEIEDIIAIDDGHRERQY